MHASIHTVALVGKSTDTRVADCMLSLSSHLAARGLQVLVNTGVRLPFPSGSVRPCPERDFPTEADILIAIGGDGTLLRAARLIAGRSIPLLGINLGHLGFLTDISPASMKEDVDRILAGRYVEDRRCLLETRIRREGDDDLEGLVLNDVVVQKGGQGRILDFETMIDGRFVNAHRGDGLVVATATGSTAYALSCGGPIVVPGLDAFVLTPICPHTLSDRPLMVSTDSAIEVRLSPGSGEAQICCDGLTLGGLTPADVLFVRRAQAAVTLLHPPDYDYYKLVRSKLHWGRGEAHERHLRGHNSQSAGPHNATVELESDSP
jgi:NAD+ kinase